MNNDFTIDWFLFWSGITPDATAITIADSDEHYSYSDINQKGELLAAALQQKYDIGKGDRIGILSKNCIEYIYLFAAAQKLGFVLVPFNYRLTSYELDQLIDDASPKLMFVSNEFNYKNEKIVLLEIGKLSTLQVGGEQFTAQEVSRDDAIFILYTSGSSGMPKGVLYSHDMMFWNSVNTSVSLGINGESVALVSMPPFHTGGWNVLLTPLLHHGGHVVLSEKFDAQDTLRYLEQYECDQFMAVPTMLKMIADVDSFNDIILPRLSYIIVGGEAMSIDLIKRYEDKNISIRQGFGMTEVGPNLTSLHHEYSKIKLGSIGKPNMYVHVKIVDEKGNIVTNGQNGELCFAGPVVTPGYWKNESETAASIIGGWFYSGDIAMMDEEGFLYIKDRKKNMFISGGENVYPAEVERILGTHPLVSEVAVIGVPDEKWGEVGKAFLTTLSQVDTSDLTEFCHSKLSKYKVPKYFVCIDTLPLNASGKIDKMALKKM